MDGFDIADNKTDPRAEAENRLAVGEVFSRLTQLERQVLMLNLGHSMSLREISRILGYSHDKVWRVKIGALRKIQSDTHNGLPT